MYDNYCEHGRYVGGCGADYMCGWCEDGTPWNEYLAYCNREIRRHTAANMLAAIFSAQPLSSLNIPRVVMSMTTGILLATRTY